MMNFIIVLALTVNFSELGAAKKVTFAQKPQVLEFEVESDSDSEISIDDALFLDEEGEFPNLPETAETFLQEDHYSVDPLAQTGRFNLAQLQSIFNDGEEPEMGVSSESDSEKSWQEALADKILNETQQPLVVWDSEKVAEEMLADKTLNETQQPLIVWDSEKFAENMLAEKNINIPMIRNRAEEISAETKQAEHRAEIRTETILHNRNKTANKALDRLKTLQSQF